MCVKKKQLWQMPYAAFFFGYRAFARYAFCVWLFACFRQIRHTALRAEMHKDGVPHITKKV